MGGTGTIRFRHVSSKSNSMVPRYDQKTIRQDLKRTFTLRVIMRPTELQKDLHMFPPSSPRWVKVIMAVVFMVLVLVVLVLSAI